MQCPAGRACGEERRCKPWRQWLGGMEVACPPAIVDNIYGQLLQQNAAQRGAFSELVADYSAVLTRSRELQARKVV